MCESWVWGLMVDDRARVLLGLVGAGEEVRLIREPNNRFDRFVVIVSRVCVLVLRKSWTGMQSKS